MNKVYKIVNSEGEGFRTFSNRASAHYYISIRPELQIVVVKENTYEDLLMKVGECKL